MTLLSRFSRSRKIERNAYRWVMKMLDDPTRHARDLERWLSLDDDHRTVFKRVAIEVGYASDAAGLSHKLRAVLASAHGHESRQSIRRWSSTGAAVAAAVIAAALAWYWTIPQTSSDVARREAPYVLRSAEAPRTYALADRSDVMLRAGSILKIHYTPRERGVDLNSGSARFYVQHNPARPFVVYVRGGKITAVGTIFDVDTTTPAAKVHLITGQVIVTFAARTPNKTPQAVTLHPGQEIAVGTPTTATDGSERDNLPALRTETFDDVPLSEIVGRANAASAVKIILADPALGSQSIFGELDLHDVRALARKLAIIIGGTVDESDREQIKIVKPH